MTTFEPDPNYELVEYDPPKRGRQCGKCGSKFNFGESWGFCCTSVDCPMGLHSDLHLTMRMVRWIKENPPGEQA
jgi:hypothetical protein